MLIAHFTHMWFCCTMDHLVFLEVSGTCVLCKTLITLERCFSSVTVFVPFKVILAAE